MTYLILLVATFSCVVAMPTATSFVIISKLFHKIIITITEMVFVPKL
jgi:hypothetical protein